MFSLLIFFDRVLHQLHQKILFFIITRLEIISDVVSEKARSGKIPIPHRKLFLTVYGDRWFFECIFSTHLKFIRVSKNTKLKLCFQIFLFFNHSIEIATQNSKNS
jgi:hypothetical protein